MSNLAIDFFNINYNMAKRCQHIINTFYGCDKTYFEGVYVLTDSYLVHPVIDYKIENIFGTDEYYAIVTASTDIKETRNKVPLKSIQFKLPIELLDNSYSTPLLTRWYSSYCNTRESEYYIQHLKALIDNVEENRELVKMYLELDQNSFDAYLSDYIKNNQKAN